ncbi:hypothetical protein KOAAANKH_02582 [Brevundimonas sp. NIBR10]|nr:hypothetical protein KOAAANKH_02582 [Brevundimonas sp. NIBR10]
MVFWVPYIIDGFWSGPGWTRTHRVNRMMRPRYGLFTLTKVERTK